jgi:hypothetical protein
VKLRRREAERWVFELTLSERVLLAAVLAMFPAMPASRHRISRAAGEPKMAEAQALLAEVMLAQQAKDQHQLEVWLGRQDPVHPKQERYFLQVRHDEIEWLLQVLNDVRVGCWIKLGAPDPIQFSPEAVGQKHVRDWVAMEFCAHVQTVLLETLDPNDRFPPPS